MNRLATRDALILTALGGTLGTFARWSAASLLGSTVGLSAGVVLANVMGAGALGYLTVRLLRSTFDPVRSERITLFFGVGLLGGFTTYSTLAVHGAELLQDGSWWTALWHLGAQIVLGCGAAVLGMLLGNGWDPRRAAGGDPHG